MAPSSDLLDQKISHFSLPLELSACPFVTTSHMIAMSSSLEVNKDIKHSVA